MKTIVSALVALTFIAGVVGPAIAAESFSIKTARPGQPWRSQLLRQLHRAAR